MKSTSWVRIAGIVGALAVTSTGLGQAQSAREVLEQAAEAMGGLSRLQSLDNLVLTGFGQYVNQQGGSAPSPDPRSPLKFTVAHDAERIFDLANERAMTRDRRGSLFPFAIAQPWDRTDRVQTGVAALDHPVPALLEALDSDTRLGTVSTEDGATVVQLTLANGAPFWLAVDPVTKLPAWVRSVGPSTTLGDLTTTTYFTGYLPFGDLRLPVGLTANFDWRDTPAMLFHVDSYRTNVADLSPLRGMPLTFLYCNQTPVTDLAPLTGSPLVSLICDFIPERDAEILRSIKTLETINGKPVAELWQEVEAAEGERKQP